MTINFDADGPVVAQKGVRQDKLAMGQSLTLEVPYRTAAVRTSTRHVATNKRHVRVKVAVSQSARRGKTLVAVDKTVKRRPG